MTEENTRMRNIPIRNPDLIDILDRFVQIRTSDPEGFEKYMHLSCKQEKNNRDWWTGQEYLDQLVAEGTGHEGYPDAMYGYEFRVNNKKHQFFANETPQTKEEAKWRSDFMHNIGALNEEIMHFMGCRNNALSAIYPPGGFIAWHNNANACAWNFIFTYSETGEGSFDYLDLRTGERVVMQDQPGWQLKAGYFGHYGEPDQVFYHTALTDCWRQTISFCFDSTPQSEIYREQVIDEISSE